MKPSSNEWINIFTYQNLSSSSKTIILEMLSEAYELSPQESLDIYVSKEEGTLPLDIQHTNNEVIIYPRSSCPTWRVFKNNQEISLGYDF